MDVSAVKALTFDVFGTVVEWRGSIIREGNEFGAARGISVDWARFADAGRYESTAGYRALDLKPLPPSIPSPPGGGRILKRGGIGGGAGSPTRRTTWTKMPLLNFRSMESWTCTPSSHGR